MNIVSTNVRSYPTRKGDAIVTMLVLAICVERHGGLYKAYAGVVEDTSTTNPNYRMDNAEWIRDVGSPLRFDEAVLHFPSLTKEKYA